MEDEKARKELFSIQYFCNPEEALQQKNEEQHFTISKCIREVIEGDKRIPWLKGKMCFQSTEEVATFYVGMDLVTDFGYEYVTQKIIPQMVKKSGYDLENDEKDTEEFCWDFGNWGCKIGGHPAVKQWDIRSDIKNIKSI